ncbi:MAG TPA: hypothetical protein VI757_08710 [Bacteroidia bacterium]|nr:hypothetical protein [Bacteroidia bacterium]
MHSHRKKYFLKYALSALTFFFILNDVCAQKFLALEKHGRIKRLRFFEGDKINIRLQDENFFRSGYIDAFTDTSFFLDGENIPVSKVNALLVYKSKGLHPLLRELTVKLPFGGIFVMSLASINSVINNDYPLIPKNIYYVAGGMAVAGLLLYPLTFRVYKVKRHPLKIIDVTISPQ